MIDPGMTKIHKPIKIAMGIRVNRVWGGRLRLQLITIYKIWRERSIIFCKKILGNAKILNLNINIIWNIAQMNQETFNLQGKKNILLQKW